MAETDLHKQLKEIYADDASSMEVSLGDYRIDAIAGETLIEIQHGSLGAIRDKIVALLQDHEVLVVKPIIHSKRLVKLDAKDGRVVDRRRSPKRGRLLDFFEELVYFTKVFPHPNLSLEAVLVDVEERRYPGHGRRRRRRARDHQVEALQLLGVGERARFHQARDLLQLIPQFPDQPFHTGQLAEAMRIDRWEAQKIAYCLRETGAAKAVGKLGNAWLYQLQLDAAAG